MGMSFSRVADTTTVRTAGGKRRSGGYGSVVTITRPEPITFAHADRTRAGRGEAGVRERSVNRLGNGGRGGCGTGGAGSGRATAFVASGQLWRAARGWSNRGGKKKRGPKAPWSQTQE